MKKIAIVGVTGMLGSAVYHYLKDKYEIILVVRDLEKLKKLGIYDDSLIFIIADHGFGNWKMSLNPSINSSSICGILPTITGVLQSMVSKIVFGKPSLLAIETTTSEAQ